VTENVNWTELVNKSVHTSDDVDIGDIEAVSRDFIVVKRGYINIHHYYVPVGKAEGWDGNVLWIKPSEAQIKEKYERNSEPDPAIYYLKGESMHHAASFPKVPTLVSRYKAHVYPEVSVERPHNYRCDLCLEIFENQHELSSHVAEQH
jgi:hypothetical protein